MASRIANFSPPGSMFKVPAAIRETQRVKRKDLGRNPRQEDPKHLALIRQCPCLACGHEPCDAAHVRMASAMFGKKLPGAGAKPDDKWTVPLCREHHELQHKVGELTFWHHLDLSPLPIAQALYAVTGDLEAMRRVVMETRK